MIHRCRQVDEPRHDDAADKESLKYRDDTETSSSDDCLNQTVKPIIDGGNLLWGRTRCYEESTAERCDRHFYEEPDVFDDSPEKLTPDSETEEEEDDAALAAGVAQEMVGQAAQAAVFKDTRMMELPHRILQASFFGCKKLESESVEPAVLAQEMVAEGLAALAAAGGLSQQRRADLLSQQREAAQAAVFNDTPMIASTRRILQASFVGRKLEGECEVPAAKRSMQDHTA